jgi:CelD/BcsL family acetyltransferase involved in cellulose biosynthesis
MDAVVADADLVGAVAGLRGLAAGGIRALALGTRRTDAALLSRHAAEHAIGPDPVKDPAGFLTRLGELAERNGPFVVYPSREETIDVLLAGPLPEGVALPFPAGDVVGMLRDKRRLVELARAGGLRTPRTLAEGAAGRLVVTVPPTPALVKPTRRGPGVPEVSLAMTPDQLRAQLREFAPGEPVLLQEAVNGDLHCVAVVVDRDGRLVERFQQAVARVWPAGAGAATTALSVEPDEELCLACARMLAAAGFWGLAQLDFMIGPDGPRVIDVNPRFYISLALALRCGANLPAAAHAVARGEDAGSPSAYRTGVSYRRLESDVSAAVHGEPGLLLARPPRPVVGCVWSASDPLPALGLVGRRVVQSLMKRVAPRRRAWTETDGLEVVIGIPGPALESEWRALEDPAGAPPYLCWDWIAAWRDIYRPQEILQVRIAEPGRPPLALGLLERRRSGRLTFAGAPVSTLRGLLVGERDASRAWAAFGRALEIYRGWRALEVEGAQTAAAGLPRARLDDASTWVASLPASFDEYLAERSPSQRKGHKQKLRRLTREGGEVVPVPAAEHRDGLREFIRLHRLRAAAKGEHHPQMDERLVELLARLDDSDAIDLRLFTLRVGDRTGGVTVRLDRPALRAAWFYNGGMDPAFERLGPGVTLELHSIRDAIERGLRAFDLGVGHWRYKEDLGGVEEPLCSGMAYAPGPRARGLRFGRAVRRRAMDATPAPLRALYRGARRRLAVSRAPRQA